MTPLPPDVRPPAGSPPSPPDTQPLLDTGRQGRGQDREVKGRAVTSPEGAGLGERAARRRLPVKPRGVLASGLGVVVEWALLQVIAGNGMLRLASGRCKPNQNTEGTSHLPNTEDSSGQRSDRIA